MNQQRMDAARPVVTMLESELEALVERAVTRAMQTLPVGPKVQAEGTSAPFLSAAEAAERLRCSRRQVSRLIASGRLRSARLGAGGSSRVLIPRESVEQLMAGALA